MTASLSDPTQRVVRVFVSSTFCDMQAERDEMVKFIFPQLRKLCEKRGVTWGEVDLRWGITDEQKAEGRVLPICLEEVRRCRPYFIGFLGERYGWIHEEIPQELVDREPWLDEHRGRSVTELEILHGVLNHPEMADHAFFYFRDPAYIDNLPPEEKRLFREEPWKVEVAQLGPEEAERRCSQRKILLAALKERIRQSGFPVREDYRTPDDLGRLVLDDLTSVIDRLFPEESLPDPLDREATEHESFAVRRSRIYIGRQEYFDRLAAHACGSDPPLVVLGESGSGKSTLLARWARGYRLEHPDELVVTHFIGATSASADLTAMLRRILGELKRRFDLPEEIPNRPAALRSEFPNWLSRAGARGRVILVLDALNQLEDRGGTPELIWLPQSLPENIRLVVSTLPGRSLEELKERAWPAMTVEPLQRAERQRFIQDYLALFSKTLDETRRDRIVAVPQTHNPLFLQLVLDELRQTGEHERLDEYIEAYLRAPDIPQLYHLILERYEGDYDRERPGLVREAMSSIWAARRGLSELELREILGTESGPLPQAYWSPLFLAMESALASRSGMLTFGNDYLRQSVKARYLGDEASLRSAHLRLADYFEPSRYLSERSVTEIPWQLARAREWPRLHELLSDLQFLETLVQFDSDEAVARWRELESQPGFDLLETYRSVIDQPQRHVLSAADVAILLKQTGHPSEAAAIHEILTERYRKSGNLWRLIDSLRELAEISFARGDLARAWELQQELYKVCGWVGDRKGQVSTVIGKADIEYLRGDYAAAERLIDEASEAGKGIGDPATEPAVLAMRAKILVTRGRFDEAITLFRELGRSMLGEGNLVGVSFALGNQGDMLRRRGDLKGAMECFRKSEELYQQHGDLSLLAAALFGQAKIHAAEGRMGESQLLYRRCEKIFRSLGNAAGIALILLEHASLIAIQGSPFEALAAAEEARSLIDQHGLDALRGQLEEELSMLKFLTRVAPHSEA